MEESPKVGFSWENGRWVWLLWVGILSLWFVFVTGGDLANYRPVSADDAWIMSASYKLATEGVFGSDLYAGFHGAEHHYFMALPGLHIIQAVSMRLMGGGIFQARLPVLLSGLLLLWLVADLSRRWFGPLTSGIAVLLLVIWRSNLLGIDIRSPLAAVSQNGRYDMVAVTLIWFTLWLLERLVTQPTKFTAFALGLMAGSAALTQFFGLFVLPVVGIAWWNTHRKGWWRRAETRWLLAGLLVAFVPYLAYTTSYWPDFVGQSSLKGTRTQFNEPLFYFDNLRREIVRFQHLSLPYINGSDTGLSTAPWGQIVMFVGALPAAWLVGRYLMRPGSAARLCGLSLVLFLAGLALFDSTKAPLYAVVLMPGLTIVYARLGSALFISSWQARFCRPVGIVAVVMAVVVLGLLAIDGLRGFRQQRHAMDHIRPYLEVGEEIAQYLDRPAAVLAAERWWWALRDYPYLALNNLWAQWRSADQNGTPRHFAELAVEAKRWLGQLPTHVIVNNNVHGDILQYSERLQHQFWEFLDSCAELTAGWDDPTYGRIEVYKLEMFTCQY